MPLDWATTQNNLGAVLGSLGQRESDSTHLMQAVAAIRAALEVLTRENDPFNWAKTQFNLGLTLGVLGERAHDTQDLQDAVEAFARAAQVDPSAEVGRRSAQAALDRLSAPRRGHGAPGK